MSLPQLEYYFSFRSPYSYLSAPRAFDLPRRYAVELVWRGIRPMAMRGQPLPRPKQLYILRDAAREAQHLGLPFGRMFDPIGDGVWRCLSIAELARERGKLEPFVLGAATAIWAEARDVRLDQALRPVCEHAGLNWAECLAAMSNPTYRERVEHNTARLAELGHWGVPVFGFAGELYWGQDRIQDLERALFQAGLEQSKVAA
jgi:2-hydroxychromene-2-carboxylate isomerase